MARAKSVVLTKEEKKAVMTELKGKIKAAKDNVKQLAGVRKEADKVYAAAGKAHVNALIVVLAPGERTVLHRHGVPTFIHILEGEVTVDYEGRGTRTYRQGESFLEAMNVTHAGLNTGKVPVKILAVYMGADGATDTIKQP